MLDGTQANNDGASPETAPSHRCTLPGVIPSGHTGPALMPYGEGNARNQFAATRATDRSAT